MSGDLLANVMAAMQKADDYYVSADQARAAVNVVLEEAAMVADIGWFSSEFCAAAIRALKEKAVDPVG